MEEDHSTFEKNFEGKLICGLQSVEGEVEDEGHENEASVSLCKLCETPSVYSPMSSYLLWEAVYPNVAFQRREDK